MAPKKAAAKKAPAKKAPAKKAVAKKAPAKKKQNRLWFQLLAAAETTQFSCLCLTRQSLG